jgi:spore coat protein CotF
MNEKIAMADTLSTLNATINMISFSIIHSNNKDLRDTFVTYRNQLEDLQWQLYVVSRDKGYYIPAAPAGQADVDAVKTAVSGN